MSEYGSVTRDRGGAVTDSIFDDSGYVGDGNDADSDPALSDDDDDDNEYGDPTGAPSYEDYGSVTRDRDRGEDDSSSSSDVPDWWVNSADPSRAGTVTDSVFDDSGYVGVGNSAATDPALSGTETQAEAQAAMGGDLPIVEVVAVIAIVAAAYVYGSQ